MKITIDIQVQGGGRHPKGHVTKHEVLVPGELPWNGGSIAAEMLRAALDAYEERMLVVTHEDIDAAARVRPSILDHLQNSQGRVLVSLDSTPTNLDLYSNETT